MKEQISVKLNDKERNLILKADDKRECVFKILFDKGYDSSNIKTCYCYLNELSVIRFYV